MNEKPKKCTIKPTATPTGTQSHPTQEALMEKPCLVYLGIKKSNLHGISIVNAT